MIKLFLDMDGVFFDFDTHYERTFGEKTLKKNDNVNWKSIGLSKNWFLSMPLMPDAMELWDYTKQFNPTFLTGIPNVDQVPDAGPNKRAAIAHRFGADVPVITCPSKEKCLHATPGAILVDDWEKHKQKWLDAGGVWITHTSAADTIAALKDRFRWDIFDHHSASINTSDVKW